MFPPASRTSRWPACWGSHAIWAGAAAKRPGDLPGHGAEVGARISDDLAEGLKATYPVRAEQFKRMRVEEAGHRHRLLDLFREGVGEPIPLFWRQDVEGFVGRDRGAGDVAVLRAAARRTTAAGIRQLMGDLAEWETWWVWRPASGPGSAWASPRPSRTTAGSRAAAGPGCAASSAV